MSGERFYVMGMQLNGATVAAVFAAFLAGVIITIKYLLTPFAILAFVSCYSVLVTLRNVILPLGSIGFFTLFTCGRVGKFRTSERTKFANPTSFAVFRHWLTAHWAWNFDTKAFGAKLIKHIDVLATLFAYFTCFTNTASIGLIPSSTGDASCILWGLTHDSYRWGKRTTIGTWFQAGIIARLADSILAAISLTNYTQVLCHIAILPQLPNFRGEL